MKHYVHIAFEMPFPDGSKSVGDTLIILEDLPVSKLRDMLKEEMERAKGMETESNAVITSFNEISEDLYNQLMEIKGKPNVEGLKSVEEVVREVLQLKSATIEEAATTHENLEGGRSAFSFVCGAEWAFNQVKEQIEFFSGKGFQFPLEYIKTYVDNRCDEIRRL